MARDPKTVNRSTKIMAKLLAEVVNDFFEPLSFKSLAFLGLMVFGVIAISELLLRRSGKV